MTKNFKVVLYKDSNCDLCKLMLYELIDNPPICDVEISHFKKDKCYDSFGNEITPTPPCRIFPTIVFYKDDIEIGRLEGFVTSKIINMYIEEIKTHETKTNV